MWSASGWWWCASLGALRNAFPGGQALELRLYLSHQSTFTRFNETLPHAHLTNITYDFQQTDQTIHLEYKPSQQLANQGKTLYAHAFFTKKNYSPDPNHPSYDKLATIFTSTPLVGFATRNQPLGLKKLLTGEPAPWEAELQRGIDEARKNGREDDLIPYWKPRMDVQLVIDVETHGLDTIPPLYYNFLRSRRLIAEAHYLPLSRWNELTVMRQHWLALNSSWLDKSLSLPLELSFRPVSMRRFQWLLALEHTIKKNEETLGMTQKESEDLRGMFVNTHPYLLYTTIAVSAIHLLFDVLAFKSDVSFWKSVETMEGLSSRSLILNQMMEVVILLYLLEQGASWLIQLTSFFTLILGFFKIFKSLQVKRLDAKKIGGVSLTDQYDALAFRHLLAPLVVMVLGYSGYCLHTSYFRSWYAWSLESLVALVYGAGFIVMTPQLFINWKLKSVAHLPWNFFMYKALNTFIDDLFAFIIKMPTLHRLSCFRDDIVFAIFLYQRWIYKVDNSRVNEFGTRGEDRKDASSDGKLKRRRQKVE